MEWMRGDWNEISTINGYIPISEKFVWMYKFIWSDLMNLYEHNQAVLDTVEKMDSRRTNIACPQCGEEMFFKNQFEIGFMELPKKRRVVCKNCNFEDIMLLL